MIKIASGGIGSRLGTKAKWRMSTRLMRRIVMRSGIRTWLLVKVLIWTIGATCGQDRELFRKKRSKRISPKTSTPVLHSDNNHLQIMA